MTPRWQYLDPPPLADGARLYGRGRRAEFFYDGFDFWRQLRSGERQAVSRLDAPARGWWHKPACNCPLCVARHSTTPSREPAGEARS